MLNILFLVTTCLLMYQHVRLQHVKRPLNFQLFMALFTLVMAIVITFGRFRDPWLSGALLILAVACLVVALRQMRYLPPRDWSK